MPYGIVNRDYYAAGQRGREDALQEVRARQVNALGQVDVQQAQRVNALAQDPKATADQYARAGRSDIGNSLTNISRDNAQTKQLDAQRLFQAAQYAMQSNAPKQFLAQNYPEIVALNPNFAQETDDQVKAGMQDLLGRFGPQAGIGPAPAPVQYERVDGPRGSVLQRDPRTNEMKQVVGPDNSQSTGGGPPSGYRWNGGKLEPIPGGPADPNTPNTRDDSRIFAKADKLRDEFNTQSKDFVTVNDAFNTVKQVATDHSAAGDLSMIFAYMKMLDPNSVVREQEFANAQNASGVPTRVLNTYNKLMSGERLSAEQRSDFINQANNLYKVKSGRQNSIVKRYTDIAKRNKVNPDDVIGDLSVILGGQQPQGDDAIATVNTPQEAMKLPSGTRFRTPDGRVKVRP